MSDYRPPEFKENGLNSAITEKVPAKKTEKIDQPQPEIDSRMSIVRAPLETKETNVKATQEPLRKSVSRPGTITIPDELLEANSPVIGEMDLPETVRIPAPLRLRDSSPVRQRTDAPQKPRSCAFTAARIKLPSLIEESRDPKHERFPACVEFVPQAEISEKLPRSRERSLENAAAAKSDHSIRNVIAAWPELPIQVRRAILELIKANLPAHA